MKSPVFAGRPRSRVERMVGARRESMLAMLEMVDEKWDGEGWKSGAEGYLRQGCGVSEEVLRRVSEVLIVSADEKEKSGYGDVGQLDVGGNGSVA